ncbi:MAG: Rrf2 family transcriptional regulator [Bryobacterales bacterium]
MQLTRHTDYGLRILIYLASADEHRSVSEIAEHYGISHNHLVKVAHELVKLGYLKTTRGRFGGMRLAVEPQNLTVGRIVRDLEPGFAIAECFSPLENECVITKGCRLRSALDRAKDAFLETLDEYTLADITSNREQLIELLAIGRLPSSSG